MDLTPQTPAEGIMQTINYPDCKIYKVECNCGGTDDAITFSVEKDHGEVVVHTFTTQKTSWWQDPFHQRKSYDIKNELLFQLNYYLRGFLNALAHRLTITWNVWIKGYVEYQQTTIMTKQQALNYASILQQAIAEIENNK